MRASRWMPIVVAGLLALWASALMAARGGDEKLAGRAGRPQLTAEERAVADHIGKLRKDMQIARLELRILELKGAPEQEIAAKAKDVDRIRDEMRAFVTKNADTLRRLRQEQGLWGRGRGGAGMGRGLGRGPGMQRGLGRGFGLGPGCDRQMGPGMGRGRGREMRPGLGPGWGSQMGPGVGRGRGFGMGPGVGQGPCERGGRGMRLRDRERLRMHDWGRWGQPNPSPEQPQGDEKPES